MFLLRRSSPAEAIAAEIHNSVQKFIILFGYMWLQIGMDSMLKLLREYIIQTGFAVYTV
jgi:hypothetical protein